MPAWSRWGPARFAMLEPIRDYALERLRAAGEEEACRRRHAAYYAHLAESASSQVPGQRAQEIELSHLHHQANWCSTAKRVAALRESTPSFV